MQSNDVDVDPELVTSKRSAEESNSEFTTVKTLRTLLMEFKTLSLNTRGFNQPFRDYLFHNLLFEADIFCFQETQNSDPSFFRSFTKKWRASCFWSPALGKQGGVMTCLSDSFDFEVVQWKREISRRVVSVVIKVNDYSINIVNIYAPTNLTERKVFFENLHEFFLPSDAIVIAGDVMNIKPLNILLTFDQLSI